MNIELLAPAGSYRIALKALISGADAVYLATERFGARAYAKNLTLVELENIVKIAKVLNKKIYVTVNTLAKDDELKDIFNYLDALNNLHVDGIITTDPAVIDYALKRFIDMEVHISTQVGVKYLEDVKFFEEIGAKRTVLARETNIDEIKRIKENSKMPLEVFVHGALCVSYSGACYLSSILTLRSGNRGRCSQNCRRLYSLKENDKLVTPYLPLLSMKDLNEFNNLKILKELKVDSLKIEGRMKDENYVKNLVSTYRKKLDNDNYQTNMLEKIFHRSYTKGFLFNEDKGNIVSLERTGNVGEDAGEIEKVNNNLYYLKLKSEIEIGDRIRVTIADKDLYFNIIKLFDKNKKSLNKANFNCYCEIDGKLEQSSSFVIMHKDKTLEKIEMNLIPLDIKLYLLANKVTISTIFLNKEIIISAKEEASLAINKALTEEDYLKQINKLQDTPFYLNKVDFKLPLNLFMPVSQINELRRNFIEALYQSAFLPNRVKEVSYDKPESFKSNKEIIVKCHTLEQVKAAKELNIKTIFTKENSLSYNKKPQVLANDNILVGNYGSLYLNKGKNITLDEEFNINNYLSATFFHNLKIKHLTLNKELSLEEIKNLYNNYLTFNQTTPSFVFIMYGHLKLMTLKYCPIKNTGYCPGCKTNKYELVDKTSNFPLIHDDDCTTYLLNGKALNLIDELDKYYPYIDQFRLDFTYETYEETKKIIASYLNKLHNLNKKTNYFNKEKETRAYYKRKTI